MVPLLFLAAAAALLWLVADYRVLRGALAWREPCWEPAERSTWPTLAMIVPARNEESRIGPCLETLLAQDYPQLKITVINDGSEDRTGEILAEAAAKSDRLCVIESAARPAGWVGKTWALQQGIAATSSEWLLLVDADMRIDPRAARVAVAEAERLGVDLYSVGPWVECTTFWQRLTCLAMATSLSVVFPAHLINDPKRQTALAAGGFLLIKRSVHEAIGGEAAVRHEIAEDLKRAMLAKAAGYKLHLTASRDLAKTHWYGNLADIWTGLRKNFYAGFNYNPFALVVSSLFGLCWVWLPFVSTLIALSSMTGLLPAHPLAGWMLTAGLIGWLAQSATALPMAAFLGTGWHYPLLLPAAFSLYGMIGFTSVYDFHFGGGPKWKNRSFTPSVVRGDSLAAEE